MGLVMRTDNDYDVRRPLSEDELLNTSVWFTPGIRYNDDGTDGLIARAWAPRGARAKDLVRASSRLQRMVKRFIKRARATGYEEQGFVSYQPSIYPAGEASGGDLELRVYLRFKIGVLDAMGVTK